MRPFCWHSVISNRQTRIKIELRIWKLNGILKGNITTTLFFTKLISFTIKLFTQIIYVAVKQTQKFQGNEKKKHNTKQNRKGKTGK